MTRFKALFAAVVFAAVVAAVPASAVTTNFHFVGAGSSAQYTMAAIAADQAAINLNAANYGGLGYTVAHWDANSAAQVADNRDSANRILPEVGNIWMVWIQDGSGNIYDAWLDVSVDSTVGVRTYSAQQTSGPGGLVQLIVPAATAGQNKIGSCSGGSDLLWPDNECDTASIPTNLFNALGGECTNSTNTPPCTFGPHLNVGLTVIRPEDALYATTRALGTLNTTTWAGLGYKGPTGNIGAPIYTAQGTNTKATPIKFALSGAADPITHIDVPAYTTIPIGAAPIVFIQNNGGIANYPIDLSTGVVPDETGGPYNLAHLFDGTTDCNNTNPAFAAFEGGTVPTAHNITVFLREPLSGTMNTTEFSLFRSTKNSKDSQEVGVTNAYNAPFNPLNNPCASGGNRERSIGTGEVVGSTSPAYGVLGNPYSIGYIFWSFSNGHKLTGSSFNYLTLDGVDPIGIPTTGQQFYNCTATDCPMLPTASDLWGSTGGAPNPSYPHLRDGTYKAWSIYRWLAVPGTDSNPADPYGPIGVAQLAQNYVDQDVADFVPFQACPLSDPYCSSPGSAIDGLSVYHSHFAQSGVTAAEAKNGDATEQNNTFNGNTLGTLVDSNGAVVGTAEAGGDEGGLIEGPFGVTLPYTDGYATWAIAPTGTEGYKVTWKSGPHFSASWSGTITLGDAAVAGSAATISSACPAHCNTTTLYVTTANPSGSATIEVPFSFGAASSYSAAAPPGTTGKKQ